jgi:hypothetical protein
MSTTTPDVHIYGHGKLLISGEYFILDGAKGLAIPTRYGQHLRAKTLSSHSHTLYWVAMTSRQQTWLNLTFDTHTLDCISHTTKGAQTLAKILKQIRLMSPSFLTSEQDIAVETRLEFPNEWGLGSSSTLIYDIATWAGVDAIQLLRATMGGSGYDVACAGADTPIIYTIVDEQPSWEAVEFVPAFADSVYFVYTGNKQLSSTAIQSYQGLDLDRAAIAKEIDTLTDAMLTCSDLATFETIINTHENLIAHSLKMTKVKDTLFSPYWGAVKSLGAWGGDFVMMTNDRGEQTLIDYLKPLKLEVIIPYDKMIYRAVDSPL